MSQTPLTQPPSLKGQGRKPQLRQSREGGHTRHLGVFEEMGRLTILRLWPERSSWEAETGEGGGAGWEEPRMHPLGIWATRGQQRGGCPGCSQKSPAFFE